MLILPEDRLDYDELARWAQVGYERAARITRRRLLSRQLKSDIGELVRALTQKRPQGVRPGSALVFVVHATGSS